MIAATLLPLLVSIQGGVAAPDDLHEWVGRFTADRDALGRRHDVEYSPDRARAMRAFYEAERAELGALDATKLGLEARIDSVLADGEIAYALARLERDARALAELEPLLPFASTIWALHGARARIETPDPRESAEALVRLKDEIAKVREATPEASKQVALRAARAIDRLRDLLSGWHDHFAGYDPLFTWWTAKPFEEARSKLDDYRAWLRKDRVGIEEGKDEPIVGDPIGREALLVDLAHERIAYTPEELLAIAERESTWCETELKKASAEMGLGDDWKAALERVKQDFVEPGKQPELVKELAEEAVRFLEERKLVTLPPLAKEVWRLEMISPEGQKTAPFFLGGEVIQVAYPTDAMEHADKLMSLRGNNVHFARATVFHELIPGHHLQGFMNERYRPYRGVFSTPFWTEGWALYWEMRFWDLGWPKSPEDRVGMLFWRMHRSARILFSLGFHLGNLTPEQCVEMLVERVGHERANAEAEVRRSLNGSYPPLYQIAYMTGALQFRALHEELVTSGKLTERAFHDAILQGGNMPIELVRARLTGKVPERGSPPAWVFAGEPSGK